jgi:hypothetical protein
MKTLFTIHAGEYLVGSHIEQHFRRVNVWIPSRDTGVDDHDDLIQVAHGQYQNASRDLSHWLNNWTPVRRLNDELS